MYSGRDDTVNNVFYRYKSGEIQEASGFPSRELNALVDDIFHQFLVSQGVENFDIYINPDVIPSTVDYLFDQL